MDARTYVETHLTKEEREAYLARWDDIKAKNASDGAEIIILDVDPFGAPHRAAVRP